MEKNCKHPGCNVAVSRINSYCQDHRRGNDLRRWKDAQRRRREAIKQKAVDYKGGKCQRCGYNKCLKALDFHHVNASEKSFSIAYSGNYITWEKLKPELDKCILLCANCHREEEDEIVKKRTLGDSNPDLNRDRISCGQLHHNVH